MHADTQNQQPNYALSRIAGNDNFYKEDRPINSKKTPKCVIYILIDCVDLNDVRNKHFVVSSMKDLFGNVASQNIVDFIKETHFYKQL